MQVSEVKQKIETELKIQGKSPQTIKMYLYFNEKFLEFINKDPMQVTTDNIKMFLAELLSKGNDPGSVALARSSLKYFYDEMMEMNLMAKIKTPKKQRKIPDVLTKEEVFLLIDNAGSLRNKLLVEFMYASGLRVSECAKLKVQNLNLEDKTGLLKFGKGGKDRFFILSDRLIKDLKEYFDKKLDDGTYIFPGTSGPLNVRSIQDVIKRIAKRSGIKKKVYCHGLRHAFATHLLESGTDIRLIQELLAHSNLQTTQFYTQVSKKQLQGVRSPLDEI
ncbi:MAG: tyrosine-type recombinase/integrase [Nanoarchaeota archaeon]|nr:tyrosine-type recombinase/integrase [Nanoarchaeota archaeon]MBU4242047.1 tyrosine-type recombinase/integrase [Nanoarchaeota archaeon]MBU4352140.1 tyrosine-type recombinase/integrase [Nanoarchaeota archaeon]MBU4456681.1 tyrosine-type recombinase/integrase [Nanoarchaeota archaeon]MCG2719187.1 tyrosine-type recombinase/integrase [Nanoarchaeota archaeon]